MIYLTLYFDGWEVMKKFHPLMKELTIFLSEQILGQKA